MAKKFTEIGELRQAQPREGQAKGDLYIKVYVGKDESATLKNGDTLRLEDPRDKFNRMIASGKVNEEEVTDQMNKIPEYVKKRVVLVQGE